MATANRGDVITLQLDVDEVETLCIIFRKIAGDPDETRRKHTAEIYTALKNIGFTAEYNNIKGCEATGSIEFKKGGWKRYGKCK